MASNAKPKLRIAFATQEAAKYACENWHYTGKIPTSKLVRLGVWEKGVFIGVILFGVGASARLHEQYPGLSRYEVCELVRVALREHETPVSRMIAIALKLLKKANPKLRLCVSFSDPAQGHHGGIYQAGGWAYTGRSASTIEYFWNGTWRHVTNIYKRVPRDKIELLKTRKRPGKLRYVMALDSEMRALASERAKPYLKRSDLNAPKAEDSMRPSSTRGTRRFKSDLGAPRPPSKKGAKREGEKL